MTIGDRVRALRERNQWRREELAMRAEISVAALTDIENNVTELPRRSTLRGIAEALGVSVEELTGEEPPPVVEPTTTEQAEVLRVFSALRGDYRRSALRLLRGLLLEQRDSLSGPDDRQQ